MDNHFSIPNHFPDKQLEYLKDSLVRSHSFGAFSLDFIHKINKEKDAQNKKKLFLNHYFGLLCIITVFLFTTLTRFIKLTLAKKLAKLNA